MSVRSDRRCGARWFKEYCLLGPEAPLPDRRVAPAAGVVGVDGFGLGLSDDPCGRVLSFVKGGVHLRVKQGSRYGAVRVCSFYQGKWRRRWDAKSWSDVISVLVRKGWRSSSCI